MTALEDFLNDSFGIKVLERLGDPRAVSIWFEKPLRDLGDLSPKQAYIDAESREKLYNYLRIIENKDLVHHGTPREYIPKELRTRV